MEERGHGLQRVSKAEILVGGPFGSRGSGVGTPPLLRRGYTAPRVWLGSCCWFRTGGSRGFFLDQRGGGIAIQLLEVQGDRCLLGVYMQGVILKTFSYMQNFK